MRFASARRSSAEGVEKTSCTIEPKTRTMSFGLPVRQYAVTGSDSDANVERPSRYMVMT